MMFCIDDLFAVCMFLGPQAMLVSRPPIRSRHGELPGAVVHANHFLHERLATDDNHRQSAADSFERQRRLESLIRPGLGQITLDNIQRYLRDQEGAPTAICRIAQTDDISVGWERAGITVASIVAEPAQRRMHVAAGNSDNAPFVTYEMD